MSPASGVRIESPTTGVVNPWNALWAMMIGFFMILVDSTIVAVANPTIMDELHTDWDGVIWVTSAYLLAYAVPLLVAGRLGDRFGPKNLYLIGLFVFTAASLWCGLSNSIEMLITARVVQGIGAALLTPQTLSTITRIFPAERRGMAMSVWGATAGVATLVGPLAGGALVDHLGWQWIFIVNVPIGILGLALAAWLVPVLPTQRHRFDILGVLLSGAAMFLIVFGLQEGESHRWAGWIWALIGTGVVLLAAFVYWQAINKHEPLIPLRVFRDRNFSLSNIGVAVIGFAVTAMIVPVMFYAQAVCGLTPTESALLTAPMAVATGLLAPVVGRIVDRAHPTPVIGFGFSMLAVALTWLAIEMTPTTPIWRLVLPFTAMGVGMAFIWSPLAATATRSLPADLAGAGSGVYNATRQVGAVLGSAGIAAFMTSRISAEMPGGQTRPPEGVVMQLPEFLREPFAAALSQSMLLPAFVALFGVVTAMFLVGMVVPAPVRPRPARVLDGSERSTEVIPAILDEGGGDSDLVWRAPRGADAAFETAGVVEHAYSDETDDVADYDDDYDDTDDDDDYLEFTVSHEPPPDTDRTEVIEVYRDAGHLDADYDDADYADDVPADADHADDVPADEDDTTPLAIRVDHPRPSPADIWHSPPVSSWHSLLNDEDETTVDEPIGFAHNGFHVDHDEVLSSYRAAEPIGHAHNGFHVDEEPALRPIVESRPDVGDHFADTYRRLAENIDSLSDNYAEFLGGEPNYSILDLPGIQSPPTIQDLPPRHLQSDGPVVEPEEAPDATPRRPRHYRDDPDDSASYGRHSRH